MHCITIVFLIKFMILFWNFYVTKHDECTCKTISVSHYSAMEIMVTFTSTYFMNSTYFFILTLRCTLVVICRHQDWSSFVTSRRQSRFWRPPEISCTSFSVVTSALTGKVSVLPTNPLSEVNVIFSQILIYRVSVLFIDDDLTSM